MLHLISCRHGPALARHVAQSFLTTPRPGHEPQVQAPAPASLDPRVAAAITRMEASPLFNAGVGAVLTSAGTVELDAADQVDAEISRLFAQAADNG